MSLQPNPVSTSEDDYTGDPGFGCGTLSVRSDAEPLKTDAELICGVQAEDQGLKCAADKEVREREAQRQPRGFLLF